MLTAFLLPDPWLLIKMAFTRKDGPAWFQSWRRDRREKFELHIAGIILKAALAQRPEFWKVAEFLRLFSGQ